VRSALAMQQTHCDMSDNVAADGAVMSEHSGHDMMAMSMTDDPKTADFETVDSGMQKSEKSHDCCSDSTFCESACNMNISASLLTQESSYIPNFTNVPGSVALITDLINKEFTPPFRPPLVSHN